MATAAMIGIIDNYTGRVRYTDVTFDGDPRRTGTILRDHYRSPDKIKDLILLGSLRSLGKSTDPSPDGIRDTSGDFTAAYMRDLDYPAHQSRDKTVSSLEEFKRGPMMQFPWDYIYLYDADSRQWLHASHRESDPNYYRGKDAFGPLSNAIGRRQISTEDVVPFRPRSVEPYDHTKSIEPSPSYEPFGTSEAGPDGWYKIGQKYREDGPPGDASVQPSDDDIERAIAEGALIDYDDDYVKYHRSRMGRRGSRGISSTGDKYRTPNLNVTVR